MKGITLSVLVLLTILHTCGAAVSPQTTPEIVANPVPTSTTPAIDMNAADSKAAIEKMDAAFNASTGISYSATLTLTAPHVGAAAPTTYTSVVTVEKAGNAAITLTGPDGAYQQMVSDGKHVSVYDSALGKYAVVDAGTNFAYNAAGMRRNGQALFPTDPGQYFKLRMGLTFLSNYALGHFELGSFLPGTSFTLSHKDIVVDGKSADFVTQEMTTQQETVTFLFTIDPETDLPLRFEITRTDAATQLTQTVAEAFSDLRLLTAPEPPSNYAFEPPANSTLLAAAPSPNDSSSPALPVLLTAGTVAPDFSVISATNRPVKLSDFKGKVVVVDFWATWCGPCQGSLPHTDKIARVWAPKGVVFLPICSCDTKDSFTTWLKAHKKMAMSFYFDPGGTSDNNIYAKLYGVDGIPTQFVIGADGKVLSSFFGYDERGDPDETALVAALKKATSTHS